MNLQSLAVKAALTRQHLSAIRSHDLTDTIESYLADRTFDSVTLSSAIVTELIDIGRLVGHRMGQDTLRAYDPTLADAVGRLEANLPKLNHALEVVADDPFGLKSLA